MADIDIPLTAKLLRMLSSENDGEVLAAGRALARIGVQEIAENVESGSGPLV